MRTKSCRNTVRNLLALVWAKNKPLDLFQPTWTILGPHFDPNKNGYPMDFWISWDSLCLHHPLRLLVIQDLIHGVNAKNPAAIQSETRNTHKIFSTALFYQNNDRFTKDNSRSTKDSSSISMHISYFRAPKPDWVIIQHVLQNLVGLADVLQELVGLLEPQGLLLSPYNTFYKV